MTKETSIIFTGDIGFDRYMDRKWEDENLLSSEILDFFHSADHVVANVEGALTNAVDDGSKEIFFHSMNPEAVTVLEKINADIYCLANNHTMDAGRKGMEDTLALAKKMRCKTIGAGLDIDSASAPVYLDEAGGIGIIAVGYYPTCVPAGEQKPGVFSWNEMELIEARIKEIKSKCRWCIIVAHGGEEFTALPSPYTRDRYLKYIDFGADIIIGHHPHVPENYEILEDGKKAIFYSLGNFIFDTDYQRAHAYTDTGIIFKLVLTEDSFYFDAIGMKLMREKGRICKAPLPTIFVNVPADEYDKLAPLAAKAFIAEERRRMVFVKPEIYKNAMPAVWDSYFASESIQGYAKGEHMDLSIICKIAARAEEKAYEASTLEDVKNYLHSFLNSASEE